MACNTSRQHGTCRDYRGAEDDKPSMCPGQLFESARRLTRRLFPRPYRTHPSIPLWCCAAQQTRAERHTASPTATSTATPTHLAKASPRRILPRRGETAQIARGPIDRAPPGTPSRFLWTSALPTRHLRAAIGRTTASPPSAHAAKTHLWSGLRVRSWTLTCDDKT